MSVDTQLLFEPNVVESFSKKKQEPEWLTQLRLDALQQVAQLPLPQLQKTNIEGWNFTSFIPYKEETTLSSLSDLPESLKEFIFDEENASVIVQKNASIVYHNLLQEVAEQGVIFTDLHTAAQQHETLLKKYLMTEGVQKDEHRLSALHAAMMSGGVFLYVPKNVELKVPLQGLFWLSGKDHALFPHIIIATEEGSQVDFVANFVSEVDDQAAVNNCVIEVFVGANSRVRVATMNNLGKDTVDVTFRRSLVERDGSLEWIVADFSDGHVISDNTTLLKGEGSQVHVKTVAFGTGKMKANVTSSIHHMAPHTNSNIHARSVMKDSASSVLNSITKIEKGASKSDGQQSGKVLMLNSEARGDANPILLIDENDVTAGHAASVGRIDPMQLYYLMSRGISKSEAEKLLIYGFLNAVISEIPSEALQKRIYQVIERKYQS